MSPLQTTGGKDESNIVFRRKSKCKSQHRTQNVKTHNRTTQKSKILATQTPPKTGDELMCSLRVGSLVSKNLGSDREKKIYVKIKRSIVI
jgi:hypothetical protein